MRMPWLRWLTHPAVVRAGGIWALLRHARLAFRLLRDERVPTPVKLLVPAAILYFLSPLDVVPDVIPVVGQLDDVSLLVLSLIAFVKLCPPHLVSEHERALDGEPPAPRPQADEPIDTSYRWVDDRPRR